MRRFGPPKVLIASRDPHAGRHWAEMLKDSVAAAWHSPADVAPGMHVDVLLTDMESAPADAAGVVAIGPRDGADVCLPPDFTPRELALACTLVAEIARLRIEQAKTALIHDQISQLANTDPLSGLANRRAWDLQLPLMRKLSESTREPLWLAIVDLDRFKQVNETHGLLAGDEVLAWVAREMAAHLHKGDFIARLGGDEFGVLLLGVDEAGAAGVLERLRAAVNGVAVPRGIEPLTASVGYAGARADRASANELFTAAEQALRQAKIAGGNCAARGGQHAG